MDEDNIQGMMGQAQLAAGTPSVEKTLSAPGMGFANEKASSVFGQPKPAQASPLETQYQQMLATARKAANDVKKRYTAGAQPVQPTAPQQSSGESMFKTAQTQGNGGLGDGLGFSILDNAFGLQSPQPLQPLTPEPPLPQFTPMKGMFSSEALPSYEYKGMYVPVPKGVDMNDSAAVNKAMAENNEYIDMLNDEEEEF